MEDQGKEKAINLIIEILFGENVEKTNTLKKTILETKKK